MKSVFLTALTLLPLTTQAGYLTTKDLALNCEASGQVIATGNATYSSAQEPKFRMPYIPAKGGFQATIEISQLSAGCAPLAAKYGLKLEGAKVPASVGLIGAHSLAETQAAAQAYAGKKVALKLVQQFGYVMGKEGSLPLYPLVHAESMYLQFGDINSSGAIPLAINAGLAHGVKPLDTLSDIEKLSLAEKASGLVALGQFGDFSALLVKLKPLTPSLQKLYGQLILKALHALAAKPEQYQALQFHVGGKGTQDGAPLAKAFNELTQAGIFSPLEVEDALFEFPALLLTGSPEAKNTCLNAGGEVLLATLNYLAAKLPVLTAQEKYLWKDSTHALTGKVMYGACPLALNPAIQELATTILPQL